jgi:hypothetical protein
MARWRVSLVGHEFDLMDLPRAFSGLPIHVVEDGGNFFLEAEEFEELSDAGAVEAASGKLITNINGVARLEDPSRRNVTMGSVHEVTPEGVRTAYVTLKATVEGRARVHARLEGGKPVPPQVEPAARWIELASRDSDVAEAMEIWANRNHDWVNLYKVLEIVVRRGLAAASMSKTQLKRFKRTANHEGAAGPGARHARNPNDPPKNPMPLAEADDLVGQVLRDWLNSL